MKGRCLICGALGRLTFDHVPPRSVVPPHAVDVKRLMELWGGEKVPGRPRRAFASVSIPSLCRECNSQRLGSEYDPALAAFANDVMLWVRSAHELLLRLPGTFAVTLPHHRVARAVIGHLLAAEERADPTAPLREAASLSALREYFLSPELAAPSQVELYVWPYARETQIVARGIGVSEYGKEGTVTGDVLKFRPLGFWLVTHRPSHVQINLPSLPIHRSDGIGAQCTILMPLRDAPRHDFPEAPGRMGVVLMSDQHTSAATRDRRRR